MSSKIFIGLNKNTEIVRTSSSGGAFSALVEKWFEMNPDGTVFGCIMNGHLEAVHVAAKTAEDCIPMRGSKYIASNLNGAIKKAAELLKNGNAVMFTGTPCQINSLSTILKKEDINSSNLLAVEVICHGVADKQFFRDYIKHLESRYKGKAISCKFRAKRKPGNIQDMQVKFDNGRVYNASSTKYDWFYSLYNNNNNNLLPGCYSCRFAKPERYADISLGDAWGNQSNFGKSLILANSEKGLEWVESISDLMDLREANYNEIDQPTLFHPAVKPDNYDEFWKIYREQGYLVVQRFVGNNTLTGKIKDRCAYVANELGFKTLIKRLIKKNK